MSKNKKIIVVVAVLIVTAAILSVIFYRGSDKTIDSPLFKS